MPRPHRDDSFYLQAFLYSDFLREVICVDDHHPLFADGVASPSDLKFFGFGVASEVAFAGWSIVNVLREKFGVRNGVQLFIQNFDLVNVVVHHPIDNIPARIRLLRYATRGKRGKNCYLQAE